MRTRVYDETNKGRMPSKFNGICGQCGERYHQGEPVSWNPRVKGSTCHAACYSAYGSPIVESNGEFKSKLSDALEVKAPVAINPTKVNPVTVEPTPVAGGSNLGEQLATAIAPYLDGRLKALVTKEQVTDIVTEVMKGLTFKSVNTVTIVDEFDMVKVDLGIQHGAMPLLLNTLRARDASGYRLNIWLVGPAGTGKTTAAKKCAEALGLPFYFTGSIDTEYKLLGFVDAQGRVISTAFKTAYTQGGVFLFDECDSSLPGALLAFNAALANGECAFPDGMYERHKDFACIAAANTWGLGATNDYVGRLKLDAAFLDRFVQVAWDIDEAMETAICGNEVWSTKVQKWRAKAKQAGIKVVISPRASFYGASLLAVGIPENQVIRMAVRRSMSQDDWNKVNS